MGVDQETPITLIPTFPRQGGRRLRVRDPIAKRTSPEGEGFPPSPKGTLTGTSEAYHCIHGINLSDDLVRKRSFLFFVHIGTEVF